MLSCGSCKFFRPLEATSGGRCHRFPPQFLMEQLDPESTRFTSGWYQPYVTAMDSCGEHSFKGDK